MSETTKELIEFGGFEAVELRNGTRTIIIVDSAF